MDDNGQYMASYWTTFGIQLVLLWNTAGILMECLISERRKCEICISWHDKAHDTLHTDIPHSTHNCIPHNLYYTTCYPWGVAVRITVMSVMWHVIWHTHSATLFHINSSCIPLWHYLHSIMTPAVFHNNTSSAINQLSIQSGHTNILCLYRQYR